MDKIGQLLASRKFWAAIAGLVSIVLGDRAGVDPAALSGAIAVIVAYILGTALEDGLRGS